MKKLVITLGICASCVCTALSQEKPQVVKVEPQLTDIFSVLDIMDIKIFRFDLTSFLQETYTMSVYIDEYENNKKTKRLRTIQLGENIKSLDDLPEKYREEFRKEKQVPQGKNEWDEIKELSLYIRKNSDSTAMFTIQVPNVTRMGQQVKLRSVGDFKTYFYQARPFTLQPASTENKIDIPLTLYGSGWVDIKNQVIRFCGESEIDPELKAEILSDIPHQYIIGIELEKGKP